MATLLRERENVYIKHISNRHNTDIFKDLLHGEMGKSVLENVQSSENSRAEKTTSRYER